MLHFSNLMDSDDGHLMESKDSINFSSESVKFEEWAILAMLLRCRKTCLPAPPSPHFLRNSLRMRLQCCQIPPHFQMNPADFENVILIFIRYRETLILIGHWNYYCSAHFLFICRVYHLVYALIYFRVSYFMQPLHTYIVRSVHMSVSSVAPQTISTMKVQHECHI